VEVELLGTGGGHDGVEDTELTGGQGTDHDATGTEPSEAQLLETNFASEVEEAGHDGASAAGGLGLVDEGQEGVSRMGDDGSGNTGDDTSGHRDGQLLTIGRVGGRATDDAVHDISGFALDGELGHSVRNLLEQDGTEAGVETADETVLLDDLGEGRDQSGGELGVRHQANAGGLEGAQEDVGDELSAGSGGEVDGGFVGPGLLFACGVSHVDLEELDTAELEPALDEVSDGGGAEAGGEGTGTLGLDDLLEAADHALVVLDGVKLDTGLNNIDGAQGAVGDGAADTTSKGTLEVVREVVHGLLRGSHHGLAGLMGGLGLAEDADRCLRLY